MENKIEDTSNDFKKYIAYGFVVLALIWDKLTLRFKIWIHEPRHFWWLIFFVVSVLACLFIWGIPKLLKIREKHLAERAVIGKQDDSVFCGFTDKKEEVWIKPKQRIMHTQIIGTTNAGKTESVILPWALQDIHKGKGLILIDGKADNSLLDKLWSYTKKANRENDFKLFSLGHPENSFPFNPLLSGTPEEITERVFNSFEFENAYYRSLQYEVMGQVMRIFEASGTVPTFQRLHQVISNPDLIEALVEKTADPQLKEWVMRFKALSQSERDTRTSGLLSSLGHFALGAPAKLFNCDQNCINLDEALEKNQIIYFQLPVLLSPFLGKATGKLVLQSLQAAIANRHRNKESKKNFFSVFLDDFAEYLYPGFVSLLNKSRSANVGIVFAHQALGDIEALGDAVSNSILSNTNLKVFMRGNDPASTEYFSKTIGTNATMKYTERQKINMLEHKKSGDVSAREVEEFIVHPNQFKRTLGVGEAYMIVPHDKGTRTIRIKFRKIDDLQSESIPLVNKQMLSRLDALPSDATKPAKVEVAFGLRPGATQTEAT